MRTARLFYAMHHRKDPARRTREDWGNFGDELNPILLERLLNLRAEWAPAARCDLLAIVQHIVGMGHHIDEPPMRWGCRMDG